MARRISLRDRAACLAYAAGPGLVILTVALLVALALSDVQASAKGADQLIPSAAVPFRPVAVWQAPLLHRPCGAAPAALFSVQRSSVSARVFCILLPQGVPGRACWQVASSSRDAAGPPCRGFRLISPAQTGASPGRALFIPSHRLCPQGVTTDCATIGASA